jgi:hypothetical protein
MGRSGRGFRAAAAAVVGVAAVGLVVAAAPAAAAPARLVFSLSNVNGTHGADATATLQPLGYGTPLAGNWDRSRTGRDLVGGSYLLGGRRRWFLAAGNSGSPGALYDFVWGRSDCVPVVGNWQGTGDTVGQACCDLARGFWRGTGAGTLPARGAPATFRSYYFGSTACTPVTGDWNGDGRTTVGVSCPNGGSRTWTMTDSPGDGAHNPTPTISFAWGSAACLPVTGNWDGVAANRADADTVGQVCRGTGGDWVWNLSNRNAAGRVDLAFAFGPVGRAPVVGNWDGRATATTHTNADTPGVVAGAAAPPPSGPTPPAANPYPPQEVRTGWTPRMRYVVDQVETRFAVGACGGEATGSNVGHVPGSDHYTGNAADCMTTTIGTISTGPARQLGDAVADWLVRYGATLRLKYVIWYGRIYDFETSRPSWQPYCNSGLTASQCANPTPGTVTTLQHYDHVHISMLH